MLIGELLKPSFVIQTRHLLTVWGRRDRVFYRIFGAIKPQAKTFDLQLLKLTFTNSFRKFMALGLRIILNIYEVRRCFLYLLHYRFEISVLQSISSPLHPVWFRPTVFSHLDLKTLKSQNSVRPLPGIHITNNIQFN